MRVRSQVKARSSNFLGSRAAVLVLIGSVSGCGYSAATAPPLAESNGPNQPASGPHECSEHCQRKAIAMARAHLGLDPEPRKQDESEDIGAVFRTMAESGPKESTITEVAVADLLDDLKHGLAMPAILADPTGHFHVLLGGVASNGRTLYQLVHGTSGIALLPETAFSAAKFPRAWKLSRKGEGVPLRIGTGLLRANTLDYNFGSVMPFEKLTHRFSFTNVGKRPLVFGRPNTSCGCTTTSAVEDAVLEPGETKELTVVIATTNTPWVRQSVLLPLIEPTTNSSREVLLTLYGSQVLFKNLTPGAIDFGVVVPGRSYSRTLTVEETAADRYLVARIDTGSLPLTWTCAYSDDKSKGLRLSKITLGLRLGDERPGKHSGMLQLKTDSRFSPDVPVPVSFEVAPQISVIPARLALGELPVGVSQRRVIQLKSADGRPIRVKLKAIPPEASVKLDPKADHVDLVVTINLRTAGVWLDAILADVETESHHELIEIKCVAKAS